MRDSYVSLFTIDYIPGSEIKESRGLVSVFGQAGGGDQVNAMMGSLKAEASKRGATHVVGVRVEQLVGGGVVIYGTAVKAEPSPF